MLNLTELLKTFLLGIVEGVTEFLPISSTGHLIAAVALLDFQADAGGTFEIFIQLGAVLAVIFYYRAELIRQITTVRRSDEVRQLWLAVMIAFIPAAVIGFIARDFIKATLFNPTVVAVSLIVGGVILMLVDRRAVDPAAASMPNADGFVKVTPRQALLIGLAQTVALIPGVSRSAASIIGGMATGLDRRTATEFSFFLAIPTLGGATIADLVLSASDIRSDELVYMGVGLLVSAVVAWLSIRWLLTYIATHNFVGFGIYRILAGTLLILLISLHLI